MSNTFGTLFRLTTFGESHGPGVGGVIDGCPAGLPLSEEVVQKALDARRPGQTEGPAGEVVSPRQEADRVSIISGIFEGKTTGAPIAFYVQNLAQQPEKYDALRHLYRPGHADFTYAAKFGHRDHRGGGRASARETLARVAGGAVADVLLSARGISVHACALEIGGIAARPSDVAGAQDRPFFAPETGVIPQWEARVAVAKAVGDSLGGLVRVEATGMVPGLGEPVFDKLDARLAYAIMGIGAVKGVEFGAGFASARLTGSANNDPLSPEGFLSNNSGGVLGGISTGQNITLNVAIKPISSVTVAQQTVTVDNQPSTIRVGGSHDVCAIPRIVPVIKSMVSLTLADFVLIQAGRRV